jgi:ATP-dependent DNA ligase
MRILLFGGKFALLSPSMLLSCQDCMYGDFQPMALGSARAPFSRPDWLFELKYDGFRALAHIDGKRTQLVSRNGHPFASFSDLGRAIAAALPSQRAVLDGEIVCLDRKGRPQFKDLLFRRGVPIAKPKHSPYEREPARTSWYKIKNRSYSQMVGRHELFERERHLEPVPGWHPVLSHVLNRLITYDCAIRPFRPYNL